MPVLTAPSGAPPLLRRPRGPARTLPAAGTPLAAAPGPVVTAPVMLPGNLLAPADSDFESPLTGNWAPLANCSLALSAPSFSGAASLAVTATASGAVTFFAGALAFLGTIPVT